MLEGKTRNGFSFRIQFGKITVCAAFGSASGFGLTYTYYTLWQTNFTIPPPIVFYVLGSVSTTYSRDIVHRSAAPAKIPREIVTPQKTATIAQA